MRSLQMTRLESEMSVVLTPANTRDGLRYQYQINSI